MPCQMGAFQKLSPAHASSLPSVLAAENVFDDCNENLPPSTLGVGTRCFSMALVSLSHANGAAIWFWDLS